MKKGSKQRHPLLGEGNVLHQVVEYDMDDEGIFLPSMFQVSGIPVDMLYKTIVCRGDKTGVIPPVCREFGSRYEKLAKAGGNKKVESVPLKEILLPLTGYIRGGVSPIGCKKDYPLYLSDLIKNREEISISAGRKGCQIILAPGDLVAVREARCAQ